MGDLNSYENLGSELLLRIILWEALWMKNNMHPPEIKMNCSEVSCSISSSILEDSKGEGSKSYFMTQEGKIPRVSANDGIGRDCH